jgi:uncharacterized radical SAM superfamily Fe-S cluster-containing enzyme
MCFAKTGPGGKHIDFAAFQQMVDRYVRLEGAAVVLQISGGEPTLHPELLRMVQYACEQPIAAVMINTNGIRLARNARLAAELARLPDRLEVYLQFDGFHPRTHEALRGEEMLATKLAALTALEDQGLRCTLVCTVEHDTNLHELGRIVRFGLERSIVRGISFQLATYCGRHMNPRDLEQRATMPDAIRAIVAQTAGLLAQSDFYPLPCAHPNCHAMAYLYRGGGSPASITRMLDVEKHMDLIANSVIFTPARVRHLVAKALDNSGGCGCGLNGCGPVDPAQESFIARALAEDLSGADVFRLTLTAFLDAHTFDVRRVMKCCLAHLLPSGHLVPFCAYNTLYRDGRVPLPPLTGSRRALTLVTS